ncbi:MAG: hypothetical protein H7Y43_10775, partial [Akkermansiaceae bacterium]|nr:hypothetical protein [Verrucomicrobiales bacterium]
SPPSANRALPLRSYITAIWVLGGMICLYWVFKQKDPRIMAAWCVATLIVMAFSLIVVISNYDQQSLRVRRKIPANPGQRALAFLFYNGAAGGITWILLITVVTVTATASLMSWMPVWRPGTSGPDMAEFNSMVGATVLYALAYALTALFIHRQFLSRRAPKLAGIFCILLPAIWALVPNIVLFFSNRLSFRAMEASQLGNVFNVFIVKDPGQRFAHLICATAWVALMVILNARWFFRQVREFRPLTKYTAPEPTPAAIPPVIPTSTGVAGS